MRILSITVKDLKILVRDRSMFIALFLSPLMFIIVMSLALGQSFGNLGKSSAITVLLVNNNRQGALSNRLVAQLELAGAIGRVRIQQTDDHGTLLTDSTSEQMVKDGKRSIAILIPSGFSRAVERGERTTVRFVVDPSSAQQAVRPVQAMVQGVLAQVAIPGMTSRAVSTTLDGKVSSRLAQQLSQQVDRQVVVALSKQGTNGGAVLESVTPSGATATVYPTVYQQNVPGYTVMYVFFIVATMASSIMQERRDGTFRRLLTTPVSKAALLLGKLLPYYAVTLLQVAFLFAVGVFVFGMSVGPHPLGLVVVTLALSACAVSLGLLIATLAKTEGGVNGLASIVVLVLAALGGCMVPPVFMPDFMVKLARVTPDGWALLGYQDVMVRGLDVGATLPTFAALMGFAAMFFLVGVSRFRFD